MSQSTYPKEFIDSMISEKRKELRAFEGLKWELTRKEDTISSQEKLIEYLMKSVEGLSMDEDINRFIDDNISYDFKNVKGLDLTVVYREYCSWWDYFYCQVGWGGKRKYDPSDIPMRTNLHAILSLHLCTHGPVGPGRSRASAHVCVRLHVELARILSLFAARMRIIRQL